MHDIFYFTDLHGQKDLFIAMYSWCLRQDAECTIIYGGDACDRGEYGYELMCMLLEDPQIIYLKGNHEDIFVQAARALIGANAKDDELYYNFHHCTNEQAAKQIILTNNSFDVHLSLNNGGYPTLRDWILNGADEEFIDKIECLPVTFIYNNIDFCHAGGVWDSFTKVNNAEYSGMLPDSNALQQCLWDRNNLALGWATDRICVHGHTPTTYLPAALYGSRDKSESHIHPAAWQDHMGGKHKRGGWKIDMDTGAAWSGKAYVLNVLTMHVIGFFDHRVPKYYKPDGIAMEEEFENYPII